MKENNEMEILDLGCGKRKHEGAVGIDCEKDSAADVIHDLNKFPYPFKDNTFDLIYCFDILEHLDDIIKVMEELYRISKPGAKIIIGTPHFSSHNTYTDLTHKRAFAVRSFDFFTNEESSIIKYSHQKAQFRIIKKRIKPNRFIFNFRRKWIKIPNIPLEYLINLSPLTQDIYERFLAFIFTAEAVYFELKVIKEVIKNGKQ